MVTTLCAGIAAALTMGIRATAYPELLIAMTIGGLLGWWLVKSGWVRTGHGARPLDRRPRALKNLDHTAACEIASAVSRNRPRDAWGMLRIGSRAGDPYAATR